MSSGKSCAMATSLFLMSFHLSNISSDREPLSRACSSMRRKVIADHLAVLHHESNPLQFRDVGDRVSTDGDEVCKFPRLNRTYAILPAQHLRCIRGDGPNHVERRHSGIAQINDGRNAVLPARFSRIELAHIGTCGKLYSRLQNPRNQISVVFLVAGIGFGIPSAEGGGHYYAELIHFHKKAASKSWRQVEEDAFIMHLLELLVGYFVAVFDGVCAGVNGSLNTGGIDRVHGDLEGLRMCFLD